MAIIQCDIRRGRNDDQKRRLAGGLTELVSEVTGEPVDRLFLVIRGMPGFNFVDAGEHVVDYVAGPNGEDVAVHDAIGSARQHMNVSIRQVPAGGLVEAGSVGPPPP